MSELLWVAVPDGIRPSGKASVRVLVVPRLGEGHIAQNFGLADWPALLIDEVSFQLRTKTSVGETIASHRIEHVARARSEVWTEFFSGDGGIVNEWQDKTVPTPEVSSTVEDAKKAAATYRAAGVTGALDDPAATDAAIRTGIDAWAGPEPVAPPADFDPPIPVVPDFHQLVANLREHPTVLLDLGLIFELLVDVADLRLGAESAPRSLSIRCTDPPFLRSLVTSPWTRYEGPEDEVFRPASAPGSATGIRAGVLNLGDSVSLDEPAARADARWAIATFDINGAVGGLRQAAHDNAKNPPQHATMPPARSIGFALLRPGRGADFDRRQRSAGTRRAAASMADTELTADDLVLGYRVDVRRAGSLWRSVCERDVDYSVNGVSIGRADREERVREEGHVKPFAAVRQADGELRADEVVLRWNGWSLALPKPNLVGDTPGPVRRGQALPFDFRWDFQVPEGRLPALRFADSYQLRVRVADIAGGGLSLGELQDPEIASTSVTYVRHDPVRPPTLLGPTTFAAGAALDRLVIRSDHDLTVEQLHAADPDYPLTEARELRAPTVSFDLIEQHRMLENKTVEESFALARRAMHADAAGTGLADPVASGVTAHISKAPGGPLTDISDESAWVGPWPARKAKMIKLAARSQSTPPVTMRWNPDTNTFEVALAKAEQAVVELSSTLDGELNNHLAIREVLLAHPTISPEATRRGRNPVVTPPRRVLVVHAVRRPLAEPRWNVPLEVTRAHHDTTALLKPVFAADTGLHTDSTGRLDVAAAWTEWEDVGETADPGKRPVTVTHLHSRSIDRGDPPRPEIRQEFGDTKHRMITYTLNAVSRFREYFKDTDPASAFELSLPQPVVNILSSARPNPPVLLGVVPAFRWQRQRSGDRIENTRLGQRLRVELARPWYETGEDERLAVIVAPTGSPSAKIAPLVTRMGRDPLFGTPATAMFPTADLFRPPSTTQLVPPELTEPVGVVPFGVKPGGDRWFADVELAVGQSYNPFVRLVVARYQEHSDRGLQLSPFVTADTVPLLPDRRVVVDRGGAQVRLTVSGTSPNPLNRLEATLEACPAGVDPDALDLVVDGADPDPAVPAWRPVAGQTVVRAADGTIPPLTLPAVPGRLRIRIRESENLTAVAAGDTPDLGRRNVFVDTIVLPAEWRP
ncbi:MAG: hypothetical protein ACRDSK_06595 [Actinophytocola sp.]|uniref:hypothetical protein n=1 Tax=Actinophytocola sp. TaxID=1872138 RepID=UPI003D6A0C67